MPVAVRCTDRYVRLVGQERALGKCDLFGKLNKGKVVLKLYEGIGPSRMMCLGGGQFGPCVIWVVIWTPNFVSVPPLFSAYPTFFTQGCCCWRLPSSCSGKAPDVSFQVLACWFCTELRARLWLLLVFPSFRTATSCEVALSVRSFGVWPRLGSACEVDAFQREWLSPLLSALGDFIRVLALPAVPLCQLGSETEIVEDVSGIKQSGHEESKAFSECDRFDVDSAPTVWCVQVWKFRNASARAKADDTLEQIRSSESEATGYIFSSRTRRSGVGGASGRCSRRFLRGLHLRRLTQVWVVLLEVAMPGTSLFQVSGSMQRVVRFGGRQQILRAVGEEALASRDTFLSVPCGGT